MALVKYKPLWKMIQNKPKYKFNVRPQIGFLGFKAIRLNTSNNIKNISKRNLTWSQASMRYPRMNPFGDDDKDGKLNMFDCRPFNRKKDGVFMAQPIRPNIQMPIHQPVIRNVQSSLPINEQQTQFMVPSYVPIKKRRDFISPPDEYDTGEILDPYYDEYLQNQEDLTKEISIEQQAPPQIVQPVNFSTIQTKIPRPHKWARPGIYNEYDYIETENPIDEYVGSGSSSPTPVRGFNPTGGGNKYG